LPATPLSPLPPWFGCCLCTDKAGLEVADGPLTSAHQQIYPRMYYAFLTLLSPCLQAGGLENFRPHTQRGFMQQHCSLMESNTPVAPLPKHQLSCSGCDAADVRAWLYKVCTSTTHGLELRISGLATVTRAYSLSPSIL